MKTDFWIIVFFCVYQTGLCQIADNNPPVMWLDRNWRIRNTEPVGSVITRVNADDSEHDTLTFGLEPLTFYGPGSDQQPTTPLPFRIDNETGVIYLNETLENRVGQDIFLYVTVSDGRFTAKTEVFVNVINSSQPFTPSGGNRMRPPYLPLPPSFPNRPPASIPPLRDIPPPDHPLGTTLGRVPLPYNSTFPHVVNYPLNTPKDNILEDTTVENEFTMSSTTTTTTTTIRTSTAVLNSLDDNVTGLYPADFPLKSPPDLSVTLIPVLSVCAIFLTVGLLAIVFRKKIHLGKTKNSKEDMAKESNGGIVLQEDPSLAMQNWRGPRAFSNRYEPWDRDTNYTAADEQQIDAVKSGDRWEFPRHRLKIFNILGEGAFGQVWKCEALDIGGTEGSTVVAVKTLKDNASDRERSDLLSELSVMKSLGPHPNVVRLLGCCTEREPVFVIMEFVCRGRLQTYLRDSRAERHHYGNTHGKSGTLTGRDLTSFVHQVAKGMNYLVDKGIVHRDLAARNILITEDHTCKVADFGFARDVTGNSERVYERKSEGRLPIRWMAPESLYDNVFTSKSDVWSFGVLMWEVVTLGSTPYPGLSAADVMRKVRDGHRLDKPEHCRRELYNIMYYCWDKDPEARPSFAECGELLENLLLTETDYIELERFPDHSYYNMVSLSGEKL